MSRRLVALVVVSLMGAACGNDPVDPIEGAELFRAIAAANGVELVSVEEIVDIYGDGSAACERLPDEEFDLELRIAMELDLGNPAWFGPAGEIMTARAYCPDKLEELLGLIGGVLGPSDAEKARDYGLAEIDGLVVE